MNPDLTNLLPSERTHALRREYFLRLVTVAVLVLAVVVVANGVLLIPSYLYVDKQIATRQARLSELDTFLSASEGKEANQRLSALTQDATYIARLGTTTTASSVLGSILAVDHGGIALSGFTYTPAVKAHDGSLILTGMASTRETLRAYASALAALPFVANVDLPISAYAKDSEIPFTITLTGSLTP